MNTESVDLGDGGRAVLARPPGGGRGAVVVLPALGGLTAYVDDVSAALVGEGFTVMAIDYWARADGPPDLASSGAAMAAFRSIADTVVTRDVDAALGRLRPEPTGLLGFCLGGSQAILAAGVDGVDAVVSYYGMLRYPHLDENKPRSPLDAAADLTVPYLGHWGEGDPRAPVADVESLAAVLTDRRAEIYVYPGAGHGFHDHTKPRDFRPVAAHDSWERTVVFLRWFLRGER